MRIAVLLLVLAACTPSPSPAPMPPDASDAAPPAPPDAGPPSSACVEACSALAAVCGGQSAPTCAATMAQIERDRLIRAPSGQPLTCACVAAAKSAADVRACGLACTGTP